MKLALVSKLLSLIWTVRKQEELTQAKQISN